MQRQPPGTEKYSTATLVATSQERGWNHLVAKLRDHSDGVIARNAPPGLNEVVIDAFGEVPSVVTRQGYGLVDKTVSRKGTVSLCPAGLQTHFISISYLLPGMFYLYL